MTESFPNIIPDRPISPEMVDQLIATALRNAGPESKKYFVLIDLDCELTYAYGLTNCDSHRCACTTAIKLHRLAGRPETPLMMCRVGGPCHERECTCSGMFMLRTYRCKGQVSSNTDWVIATQNSTAAS